jgi:NAD(P)-dependent dehydrogenase (short-subunit alcohol dehydrogenase family)
VSAPQPRFLGRRALVTGAAGGIGSAIVERLRADGAEVVATDTRASDGVLACDVSSESAVADAFGAAAEEGALTDVVHAAGICRTAPIAETEMATWREVQSVNLDGTFLVAREAARKLPDGGGIVLVASVSGVACDPFFGAYCASKFGVVALTQVLARELANRRIRVNALCPGEVRTAMSEGTLRDDAKRLGRPVEQLRELAGADPFLGRGADPSEVADAAAFLLSAESSYISGHSLVINGGGSISAHR